MKCRPDQSARETAGSQPDQRRRTSGRAPGVAHINLRNDEGGERERREEAELAAHAVPVEQDQREHAPDRDVVEAGVAQDALADRLAQDVQFFHQQDQDRQRGHRAGHADAEHELPGVPFGADPAAVHETMTNAATQPNSSGTPSARPAVMPLSRR